MADGGGGETSEPYVETTPPPERSESAIWLILADTFMKCVVVKYAEDEKNPNTYVRVNVRIKGLKKGTFTRPHFLRKKKSLCLRASILSNNKTEVWEWRVKELCDAIFTDKEKTYWKIKQDDEVILMLCKAKPESWVKYLGSSGSGLDIADS